MSAAEVSKGQLETGTERPALRAQRPPPLPPASTLLESFPSIEIISSPDEIEITPPLSEKSNESMKDVEGNRPQLLKYTFEELFDFFDYTAVRQQILTRKMKSCPFTAVLWRIFLHCLPRDSSQWNGELDRSRARYDDLAKKYLLDPDKIRKFTGNGKVLNHPLSQDENSLWHQYYAYERLRDNIEQDVKRTCQEMSFFRQKHILELLSNVLYVHAREYELTLPYRQGMHEILAVLIYLIHTESENINLYPDSTELMKKLYDTKYLAHDAYTIHEKMMTHLQLYYDFKQSSLPQALTKEGRQSSSSSSRRSSLQPFHVNETIRRVERIFRGLRYHDAQLYQKLKDLSIEPAIYGIRWLRLLFGREIPFESIPTLWTVIFCYDEVFKFVDYVFLALLKKFGEIFEKLDIKENSSILQYLMQPNIVSDVEGIIEIALSFEKAIRQLQLTASYDYQLASNSSSAETSKPASPNHNSSRNPLIDLANTNSKDSSSNESEMDIAPGKESRQRLETNTQTQKNCARYIRLFLDRVRKSMAKQQSIVEEEVLIQLKGLEQIANALEGKLPLDETSFESLLKYYCNEESLDFILNDTD